MCIRDSGRTVLSRESRRARLDHAASGRNVQERDALRGSEYAVRGRRRLRRAESAYPVRVARRTVARRAGHRERDGRALPGRGGHEHRDWLRGWCLCPAAELGAGGRTAVLEKEETDRIFWS